MCVAPSQVETERATKRQQPLDGPNSHSEMTRMEASHIVPQSRSIEDAERSWRAISGQIALYRRDELQALEAHEKLFKEALDAIE